MPEYITNIGHHLIKSFTVTMVSVVVIGALYVISVTKCNRKHVKNLQMCITMIS